MAKYCLIAVSLVFSACTTVENDPATSSVAPYMQTRVDFQPLSQHDRNLQLAVEKQILAGREAELEKKLEALKRERETVYDDLARDFPDCRSRRHCLTPAMKGNVKLFEAYRDRRIPLAKLDSDIAETEQLLGVWRSRYGLRSRALYNRYLVGELINLPKFNPQIKAMKVKSLEAYRDRAGLSRRLLELMDPNLIPTIVGDLDLRMLGKPVDEAAVLALFSVEVLTDENKIENFFITFLANTHQIDSLAYEKNFRDYWSKKIGEKGQIALRQEIYCSLYSIASDSLLEKVSPGRLRPCRGARELKAGLRFDRNLDTNNPAIWVLPVSLANHIW